MKQEYIEALNNDFKENPPCLLAAGATKHENKHA